MTPSPSRVHPGPPDYTYSATVVHVHDGDTLVADIRLGHIGRGVATALDRDYGFHIRRDAGWLIWRRPIRLAGLNAIELAEPGGPEARDHLAGLLPNPGTTVILRTHLDQLDLYERVLAVIWRVHSPNSINEQMIEDGYAAPWTGHGPRPVPTWPIPTR